MLKTTKSQYPCPPFLFKLFDADTSTDVYKEISDPPLIPENRIIFGNSETDVIPDSIEDSHQNIVPRLQSLNNNILQNFIDLLFIIQQPEYFLIDLKNKEFMKEQKENFEEEENGKQEQTKNINRTENINRNESQIVQQSKNLKLDSEIKENVENNVMNDQNFVFLNDANFGQINVSVEHERVFQSQLTPMIKDKTLLLQQNFLMMRDILNSLRPAQARMSIIHVLQQQLAYKRKRLEKFEKYTKLGNISVNKNITNNKQDVTVVRQERKVQIEK